jgi:hypothetical protein
VSISLFPGAVNADLAGSAGSFLQRAKGLLGTCMCFILSGGSLESLTDDLRREEQHAARGIRSGAESSAQTAQRHVRQNSGISEELDSDEPLETAKVYHRAITSLYAGTDPGASRLNGKVRTRIRPLPELPLISRLTGHIKYLFSISPPGHASHFQVRRRSILNLGPGYGTGVRSRSRKTPRPMKTLKSRKTLRLRKTPSPRSRKTPRSKKSPRSWKSPRQRTIPSPRKTSRSKKPRQTKPPSPRKTLRPKETPSQTSDDAFRHPTFSVFLAHRTILTTRTAEHMTTSPWRGAHDAITDIDNVRFVYDNLGFIQVRWGERSDC